MVKRLLFLFFLLFLFLSFTVLIEVPKVFAVDAYQGQTCDTITQDNPALNQYANTYPSCNTTDTNASGQKLQCNMFNGLPYGVCQFPSVTLNCTNSGTFANGTQCACPGDCQSGICAQYSGGVVSTATFCQPVDYCGATSGRADSCTCSDNNQCKSLHCTATDTGLSSGFCYSVPTDTPDPCASTHKGNGCTCQQGTDCSSGYCSLTDSGSICSTPPATPTPVPVCDSVAAGVVKVTLGSTLGCYPVGSSEHATITCNDGTKTSPFTRCTTLADFTTYAVKFCASHITCIYPTLTPTPSNTPTPTNTPTPIPPLKCDPNGDNNIDERDFQVWKDEFTSGVGNKSACFAPDVTKVDLLDFQVWKDINFGIRAKF